MDITQTISNFPPAPNSQTDTPTEFNSKADAFVHHQADVYNTEVNTWATQANRLKGECNNIKGEVSTIAGSIPAGTINDGAIGTDKVWSSDKVSKMIEGSANHVKLADGTLICYGAAQANATGYAECIFSHPFINTSFSSYFEADFTGQAALDIIATDINVIETTRVVFRVKKIPAAGGAVEVANLFWGKFMAVGRWK